MKKAKRRLSSILAYAGGFLLIITGYSAHNEIVEFIAAWLSANGFASIASLLSIVILLGMLGGFTVIAGGYAVARNHLAIGCFLISTGSGFSLLEFILFLAVKYHLSFHALEVFLTSLMGMGIILSISARVVLGDYI